MAYCGNKNCDKGRNGKPAIFTHRDFIYYPKGLNIKDTRGIKHEGMILYCEIECMSKDLQEKLSYVR